MAGKAGGGRVAVADAAAGVGRLARRDLDARRRRDGAAG